MLKPILFNTDMVKAILNENKSVTRRLIKPQPENAHYVIGFDEKDKTFQLMCGCGDGECFIDWLVDVKPPYWYGDTLYVRETWQYVDHAVSCGHPGYVYKATDPDWETMDGWTWKPSIHMPKEAARIYLRVVDIRPESLQRITNDDALAEGAEAHAYQDENGNVLEIIEPVDDFRQIWDGTIPDEKMGEYGWDANPWVWRIEFERISKEDAGI